MQQNNLTLIGSIRRAIYRARFEIISVGLIYIASVIVGAIMVHGGNKFALAYRDKIVANAHKNDPAAIVYNKGRRLEAAILDFGGNLFIGALPQTIIGLTVVSPYGFGAYRGWVGGIVSVDSQHQSRLSDSKRLLYYILTLLLQ